MRHPAQKLYYCAQSKLLYVGIAGSIQIFDTASGILLKQWDAPQLPTVTTKKQKQQRIEEARSASTAEKGSTTNDAQPETVNLDSIGDEEGAAVKKRKVDDITSSSTATATVVETKVAPEPTQKRKKISFREAPGMGGWSANKGSNLITHVVGTTSGRYLVVATNEDKTVRVFRVLELVKGRDVWAAAGRTGETVDGELQLLSERQMPKRLCALQLLEKKKQALTEEEETNADGVVIICGDKFGDVYSLPLIYNPEEKKVSTPAPGTSASESAPKGSSATPEPERKAPRDTGIITTARNKRAAKKAGETTGRNSIANLEAKELQFKHKILLGHVSLLLDVIPVSLEVELPDGAKKLRTWILSADKDEHIRVTRYPQSYVIDGFCFGHASYVAKLLTPSWNKSVLISGGGDDYLLRWDWQSGNICQKLDLKEHVLKVLDVVGQNEKSVDSDIKEGAMEIDSGEDEPIVSVTGLWDFRDETHGKNQVLVSVEGLPAIFVFTERVTDTFEYTSTIGVSGNVLDATILDGKILVSVDSQSTPYQLPVSEVSDEESKILIDCIEPDQNGHFTLITSTSSVITNINRSLSWEITSEQKEKLDEFLYAAKHLRKFEGDSTEKGGD